MSMNEQAIRLAVRERYARAAAGASCCGDAVSGDAAAENAAAENAAAEGAAGSCCGGTSLTFHDGRAVPEEIAGASLGCGAPIDAADLRRGETVVDLGSGAGLDIFLAADRVGPDGRGIGVDMTPEMIAKARGNAERLAVSNAEFRLGEIEHLPLAAETADVIVSNCVINLLPDKRPAFTEAFRVLRPGGRLLVSDIVSTEPLPAWMRTAEQWTACIGGAIPIDEYLDAIRQAGFTDIEVLSRRSYAPMLFSATVRASKPART